MNNEEPAVKKGRFLELEGLRGIAAVVVAVFHLLIAFYSLMFYGPLLGDTPDQNMRFEDNIYGNPLAVFLSGTFAVAIFFVLSGFVLSIGFFKAKDAAIVRKLASRRYLRLMLPALASTMLCLILLALSIDKIDGTAAVTHSRWLAHAWDFSNAGFFDALYSGTVGIFLHPSSLYNNVLWTMYTEFLGSFIVFGFLLLIGHSRHRWIGYTLLIVLTFNTWFLAIVAGMMLADLYTHRLSLVAIKRKSTLAILLAAALFLGGYPLRSDEGTIYQFLTPDFFDVRWMIFYLTIGAVLLIFTVIASRPTARFLSNKYLSSLGKYTFSIYLLHVPVLYTFTTNMFILLHYHAGLGFNRAALLAIAASLPVIAIASYLFERYVDAPSIRLASRVGDFMLSGKNLKLRKKAAAFKKKLHKRLRVR